ncbi:MAG: tRNA dihydrouridine synthase DusB [Candidatus Woesearchaeota archaeon]
MKFNLKVFLAPMAGITDIAFRELCVEYGAGLTCTELISCKAILQNNKKTLDMLKREKEKPFSIQLFGSEIEDFVKAAKIVEPLCDIIDINMGCPAQKVMKTGAGSALLDNPDKCAEIVKAIKKVVKKPVSIKIRLGVKKFTALDVAKKCEKAGVDLITIHGRYTYQGYSGKADWEKIKEIANSVKIPVVGNGDVKSVQEAVKRFSESSVDYIAIGRGASGNPFIFKQINDYLKTGKYKEVTIQERKKAFSKYLELAEKYEIPFIHQKLQAQHFIKGISGATKAREKISFAKTQKDLKEIVKEIMVNSKN